MEEYETRKLVRLGTNSLIITLPKSWLTKNNLEKGNTIYVREHNNDLILKTEKKLTYEQKEISIEIGEKNLDYLKAEIITAYLCGYDVITIHGKRLKGESSEIKQIIHNLIGLEIIEETGTTLITKELLDIEKTSFNNIFRRIDYLIRGMIDDLIECKCEEDQKHIYERDYDVNRLTYLIFRTIQKAIDHPNIQQLLKTDVNELMHIKGMVSSLEHIGDFVKRFGGISCRSEFSTKEKKEISALLNFYKEKYLETLEAYYKKDKNKAYEIELANVERINRCRKFVHDYPKYFNAELCYLFQSISRSLRDIARVIIEIS